MESSKEEENSQPKASIFPGNQLPMAELADSLPKPSSSACLVTYVYKQVYKQERAVINYGSRVVYYNYFLGVGDFEVLVDEISYDLHAEFGDVDVTILNFQRFPL